MSERYKSLTVVLDSSISHDDADTMANLLGMMRGVVGVRRNEETSDDVTVRMRLRSDVRLKLYEAIDEAFGL